MAPSVVGECAASSSSTGRLYGGSARYYQPGRLPYPRELAERLVQAVSPAATRRLLDVGCGPGRLTLLLADRFTEVVGIDADRDMVRTARTATADLAGARIANVRFAAMRAEELPADLGRFDVVTFALSFHWLDQARVARAVFQLLRPGGVCVHVYASSLRGEAVEDGHPLPPYDAVTELLDDYLGPHRRVAHAVPGEESAAMRAAGFRGPEVVPVPGGEVVTSTIDGLVARSYSTSGATPDRLGAQRDSVERDLRRVFAHASPTGQFQERLRDARLDVWRRP